MTYQQDWPKTIQVSVVALVVGALLYTGKLPPAWSAAIGVALVHLVGSWQSTRRPVELPHIPAESGDVQPGDDPPPTVKEGP